MDTLQAVFFGQYRLGLAWNQRVVREMFDVITVLGYHWCCKENSRKADLVAA